MQVPCLYTLRKGDPMTRPTLRKAGFLILAFVLLFLVSRFLLPILLPFLLAAVLTFAAEPLVCVFEKKLRLPSSVASGIGIFLALVITCLLVILLCSLLLKQLTSLTEVLPNLEETALSGMHSLENLLLDMAQRSPEAVKPMLTHGVQDFFSDGTKLLDQATGKALSLASGVVTKIPDGALSFGTWIIASFMLSAKLPKIRAWCADKLPESWKKQYLPAVKRLKKNLSGWLLAQGKLSGITFLVLFAGFFLLRIPHFPLWAALIGLVDALPVFGTGTVLIPWSILSFLQGNPAQGIGLLGIYACAAILRSVLEPKFIGKQLGLDPLITLLSIYAGYRLWGIPGMLFSPLLAVTLTQLGTLSSKPGETPGNFP